MSAGSSAHPNAIKAVKALADKWDVPYVYAVRGGERIKGGETTTLTTLWSKPSRERPVPEGVVNVHWVVRQRKGTSAKTAAFDVERYKIENERNWCAPRAGAPTPAFMARILARKVAMRALMPVTLEGDGERLEPPAYAGGASSSYGAGGGSDSSSDDDEEEEDEEDGKEAEGKRAAEAQAEEEEILDVEGYLIEQFKAADSSGDGVLDAAEFTALLKSVRLGVSYRDVELLHAVADEDADGRIEYEEFVPLAMDLLNAIKAKASADAEGAAEEAQAEAAAADAVRTVHAEELARTAQAVHALTDSLWVGGGEGGGIAGGDSDALACASVPRAALRDALHAREVPISKHERAMVLAMVPVDAARPKTHVMIGALDSHLREARVNSLKRTFLQKHHVDHAEHAGTEAALREAVGEEVAREEEARAAAEAAHAAAAAKAGRPVAAKAAATTNSDGEGEGGSEGGGGYGNGGSGSSDEGEGEGKDGADGEGGSGAEWSGPKHAKLRHIREALRNLRTPLLSKMQVVSLMADAAPDDEGDVDLRAFVPHCAATVDALFEPRMLAAKAALCARAELQPAALMGGKERAEVEGELSALFDRFDVDDSGTLDAEEFVACLDATSMGLSHGEISALYDAADEDGDGVVDYAEFMKVAFTTMLAISREKTLRALHEEEERQHAAAREKEKAARKAAEKKAKHEAKARAKAEKAANEQRKAGGGSTSSSRRPSKT